MNDYQAAVKNAGLAAECIVPGIIGPVNAFEMALPQVFANESVALVDIGFKHSSICVLDRGELALIRVVNIGGDKLTAGLAEAMNITYADAEGVKLGIVPANQSEPAGERRRARKRRSPRSTRRSRRWAANCARRWTFSSTSRTGPSRKFLSAARRQSRKCFWKCCARK